MHLKNGNKKGDIFGLSLLDCPTSPFTIWELHNQEIVEFYVVQKRLATDFKAVKFWKGRSGGKSLTEKIENFSDWLFHNFQAFRSGDRRVLFSSETSCDEFWSTKFVKGPVGNRNLIHLSWSETTALFYWWPVTTYSLPARLPGNDLQ